MSSSASSEAMVALALGASACLLLRKSAADLEGEVRHGRRWSRLAAAHRRLLLGSERLSHRSFGAGRAAPTP